MKITVYGAASNKIDESYIEEVEAFGRELVKKGHSLVYGGGAHGLMGAVARGVKEENGHILGIAPTFFLDVDGELFEKCDEFIYTESMRERKFLLEEHGDAFVVVPGGAGTFEEFFEALTLKQLKVHQKAIIIYNIDGYYDVMEQMLQQAIQKRFIRESNTELYHIVTSAKEVFEYLDNYTSDGLVDTYRDI